MKVTNTSRSTIPFPDGTPLPPGIATTVTGWDVHSQNAVVRAWVERGVLVIADEPLRYTDEA